MKRKYVGPINPRCVTVNSKLFLTRKFQSGLGGGGGVVAYVFFGKVLLGTRSYCTAVGFKQRKSLGEYQTHGLRNSAPTSFDSHVHCHGGCSVFLFLIINFVFENSHRKSLSTPSPPPPPRVPAYCVASFL